MEGVAGVERVPEFGLPRTRLAPNAEQLEENFGGALTPGALLRGPVHLTLQPIPRFPKPASFCHCLYPDPISRAGLGVKMSKIAP